MTSSSTSVVGNSSGATSPDPENDAYTTAATTPMEDTSRTASFKSESATSLPPPDAPDIREEKNWLRLQFLLKQSKVYASILAEKMEAQQAALKREAEATMKHQQIEELKMAEKPKETKAEKTEHTTRRTTRHTTAIAAGTIEEEEAKEAPKIRGRKATAHVPRGKKGQGNYSIANYLKKDGLKAEGAGKTTAEALAAAGDEVKDEKFGQQTDLRPARQPKLVTGCVMKPYQLEGLDWLCSLYENGLNGILADEMGLGKTLQTIAFLAFLREKGTYGPFLVVAPVSTLANWIEEFARFTPDIPTVMYYGNPQEREEIRNTRMTKYGADFPIVCTSYELIMKDRKFLQKHKWGFIIIDEGHRIKNLNCKLIRELKSYDSANRLLLTGTPLQNNLAELWSLLNFLLPDIFDDLDSFQSWFDFSALREKEGQNQIIEAERKTQIVSSLHAILKPFLLRRVKTDVEMSLPPKREYVLYAPLTQAQKDLYTKLLDGQAREYLIDKLMSANETKSKKTTTPHSTMDSTPQPSASGSRSSSKKRDREMELVPALATAPRSVRKKRKVSYREIEDSEWFQKLEQEEFEVSSEELSELDEEQAAYESRLRDAIKEVNKKKLQNLVMQLRQVCNTPHLFYWPWEEDELPDESIVAESGKMMLLDRVIPALFEKGHKVLIFSQFTTQLDIIQEWAELLRGYQICRIDGSVKLENRQQMIKAFNTDPKYKMFLLSTRAGGLGINLTAADTVILFDSDWNPQQDLQAQDRAHRIGQKKPVIVYRFATGPNTIETLLLDKAESKRKLERLVIQKGKFRSVAAKEYLVKEDNTDELSTILQREDFEKIEVLKHGEQVLSDEELEMLMDRSREAYERAERGEDQMKAGRSMGKIAAKIVETKIPKEGVPGNAEAGIL